MSKLRFSIRTILIVTLLAAAASKYMYQLSQFKNWEKKRDRVEWIQAAMTQTAENGQDELHVQLKSTLIEIVNGVGEPPYAFPQRWIAKDLRDLRLSQKETELVGRNDELSRQQEEYSNESLCQANGYSEIGSIHPLRQRTSGTTDRRLRLVMFVHSFDPPPPT